MEIVRSPDRLQQVCLGYRPTKVIGLVPTMGYFHAGHLSLMNWMREHCDILVVSLFVNPSQFGPGEDLETYPRDAERDARLAEEHGVDILFMPPAGTMYARDHATWVEVPALARGLCGASRPVHFRGVATVVTKLFNLVQPHVAAFGEKDRQQLAIIRRMVRDLNMPVKIAGRPIVREPDGLAMSSRNAYLADDERKQAPALYKGLQAAEQWIRQGEVRASVLRERITTWYAERLPAGRLDYFEVVDPDSMHPVSEISGPVVLAVALYLGKTRLIDNILVDLPHGAADS
ncbi:pantoate--beta-alanine ligase [Desulfoplanes formicivorans]|uniref:Pantothenate synthetase n=1 Tax=Desulfoplanes formicivorans TaxID=1592317 RepID=A0A194AIH3_9BACT|nr:pantoate--beta-alanine ligase [Desulfoplanes formicivorans]GAU08871.1 pantoate--beta-alanine ligase [Desulfoplanes formicivorans]